MKKTLQELRERAGFKTPEEFAKLIGMSSLEYLNYEKGYRPMTLSTACVIADGFDCSLDAVATAVRDCSKESSVSAQNKKQQQ